MKQKILVGWIDGGSVRGEFAHSLLDLYKCELQSPSDDYEIIDVVRATGSHIEENRNHLVLTAQSVQADWLLQIDSDMTFGSDILKIMMKIADDTKKIITGVYANVSAFHGDHYDVIADSVYGESPDGTYFSASSNGSIEPFIVDACGAGILLTHMSVFEAFEYPWFELVRFSNTTTVLEPQLMTEDIVFCRKARECGFQIWCHPLVETVHWKTLPLVSSNIKKFMEQSYKIKDEMDI